MGKRGKSKRGSHKKLDADLDEELDDYQPSESDEEFGKDEKILLDNRRGTKKVDSEEEVFRIHSSSDDDFEGEDEDDKFHGGGGGSDLDSDIGSKGSDAGSEAGLPDSKAWGSKSSKYYNTDYVDKDFGGMSKEDEELADMEEQEAINIQKRLMSHMEETDFTMGLLDKVEEKKVELSKRSLEEEGSEKIISDLSQMSKAEKIQLLKQESPELFELVEDFVDNMKLAKDKLLPIIKLSKEGKLASCPASEFVQTLFSVILNYSTNIIFYLLLKSRRTVPVDTHPVVQRLYTYKKLLDEMHIVLEDKLMDQIDFIVETQSKNVNLEQIALDDKKVPIAKNRAERRKRQLRILEEAKKTEKMIERKKAKLAAKKGEEKVGDVLDSDIEEEAGRYEEPEESEEDSEEEGEAKRAITYEMKKNKGLTPRRKKEDRNPRVKNRNKYRKAKIRRKGQVREVHTEVNKYGGEMFGIKTHTSKSIKIKS